MLRSSKLLTRSQPRAGAVTAALLAAAAVAWLVVIRQADGMASAPGTMGYDLAGFLAFWTVMMAAMMLPAVAPVGGLYARAIRAQSTSLARGARTAALVAGYLVAWAAFGLVAFAASDLAGRLSADGPGAARWAGAAVLVAAGAYQFTPLKNRCLAHCRAPLGLLLQFGSYRGRLRDARAGLYHGAYCVGCCWGLMVALFALGVMSLFWMAVVAAVILVEKLAPQGERLSRLFAVALVALGIWVASAPASVPGLVEPSSHGAELARMRMMGGEMPAKGMVPTKGMTPAKGTQMGQMPAKKKPAMPMSSR
jgi:predicted metal-binding membrane protein